MNPDGFEVAKSHEGKCHSSPGRANANGKDLNRNFPTFDEIDWNEAQLMADNLKQEQL